MSTFDSAPAITHLVDAKYYQLASSLILFYDHVLTLDLEWENIWKRRWSFATILFLLNRYFPLICYTPILISLHQSSWSQNSCETFLYFPFVMVLVSETVIGMIVMLRLYALYLGHWQVPFGLAAVYIFQLLWGAFCAEGLTLATGFPAGSGCVVSVRPDAFNRFPFYFGTSAIFDCVVFILTLNATLRMRPKGVKIPIADLFLRDGIMYFAFMFTAKVVNFIVFWLVSRNLITINWTFNHTITVIMISRLMLNLRDQDTQRRKGSGPTLSYERASALLDTVVGNLGAPIDAGKKLSFDLNETTLEFDTMWPGSTYINWQGRPPV